MKTLLLITKFKKWNTKTLPSTWKKKLHRKNWVIKTAAGGLNHMMVYLIQCDFCQGLWLQSCWTQLQFLCQLCPVVQINHQVPFELSWTFKIPKLESHIHLQKKQGEKPLTSPVLKPSMIFNNDMSGKETVYPLTVKYPEGLSLWIWKKIQQALGKSSCTQFQKCITIL